MKYYYKVYYNGDCVALWSENKYTFEGLCAIVSSAVQNSADKVQWLAYLKKFSLNELDYTQIMYDTKDVIAL